MGQSLRPAFKVCALPSVRQTNSAQPDQTFHNRFTSTPAKCPLVLVELSRTILTLAVVFAADTF